MSAACITDTYGERLREATATLRDRSARDSEPRPRTIIDWLVWLPLWPVVTVAWLVAVPFILLYVSVAFIIEAFFETCLPRTENSCGTEPPRRGFGEGQRRREHLGCWELAEWYRR